MKILITGANGQLGQSIRSCQNESIKDQFFYTDLEELDILDASSVKAFIQKEKPEVLINCSAYTAVDKAESEPDIAQKINAEGPSILAREIHSVGGKMIHISTDYVFDGKKGEKYKEEDKTNPDSVYGKTKADGESEVLAYPGNIIIRTAWLYSTYGNNFFKTMIRLMSEKEELRIVNDQFGTPTFADDLARAILQMVRALDNSKEISGIFHFSNEGETNWFEFAKEIRDLGKLPCKLKGIPGSEYPTAARRPPYSVLNIEKIKNTLKIDIPNWKDSLKLCFKKYKNQ